MKTRITSTLTVFILITSLLSCSTDKKTKITITKTKKLPLVETVVVLQQDITSEINIVGTIKPNISGIIKAPENGIIEQLKVRENQHVSKGQIIAMLNPTERLALISKNKQQVQNVTAKIKKSGHAPDSLQQELQSAQVDLDLSYKMFQRIPITAELTGVISERWIDSGSEVSERDQLLEIYQPSSLVIKAEVNEKYYSALQVGKKLNIKLSAYPNENFTGTISLIYPKISEITRSISFDIKLDKTTKLLQGMMAEITLETQSHENAFCVLDDAILTNSNEQPYVFVIDSQNIAHKKNVALGISSKGLTEILSGINPKDMVVVKGQELLKDGSAVKIMKTKGL